MVTGTPLHGEKWQQRSWWLDIVERRPHPPLTLPGQTALIADTTAVTFVFVLEDGAPPLLNVAGAPGDFHECPKAPASRR